MLIANNLLVSWTLTRLYVIKKWKGSPYNQDAQRIWATNTFLPFYLITYFSYIFLRFNPSIQCWSFTELLRYVSTISAPWCQQCSTRTCQSMSILLHILWPGMAYGVSGPLGRVSHWLPGHGKMANLPMFLKISLTTIFFLLSFAVVHLTFTQAHRYHVIAPNA